MRGDGATETLDEQNPAEPLDPAEMELCPSLTLAAELVRLGGITGQTLGIPAWGNWGIWM